jgi:hypothetical protein
MAHDFGQFPFGQPNTERPMRMPAAGPAKAMLVGVYPSAWHVRWTAPSNLRERGRTGGVSALAVDVEPQVFWNGDGADFAARRVQWCDATGFIEGDHPGAHGTLAVKSPPTNGSSGRKVEGRYLAALKVEASQAAFTDVCPVFFAKYGQSKRRPQGTAIEQEYNSIAAELGLPPATLPPRPPVKALVTRAVEEFGDRLLADLERAEAPLVVTFGEEVLQTLRQLPKLSPNPPAETLPELFDRGMYGAEGTLEVNGRSVRWLPLPHPGLLNGDVPLEKNRDRKGRDWNAAHEAWERDVQSHG